MQVFNDAWDACTSPKFYAYKVPQKSVIQTLVYFLQIGFVLALVTTALFTIVANPFLAKLKYSDIMGECMASFPSGLTISMIEYQGKDSVLRVNKKLPVAIKSPPLFWGYSKDTKQKKQTDEERLWKYVWDKVGVGITRDKLPNLVVFAPKPTTKIESTNWDSICKQHHAMIVTVEVGVVVCTNLFDKHPLDIADIDVLSNPSQFVNDLTGTHEALFIPFGNTKSFRIDRAVVKKFLTNLDKQFYLSHICKTKAIVGIFAAILFVLLLSSFMLQWLPIIGFLCIIMSLSTRCFTFLQLTCYIPFLEAAKISAYALTPAILYYSVLPPGIWGFVLSSVWFVYVCVKLPQFYNQSEYWMEWWRSLTPIQQRAYYQQYYPQHYAYLVQNNFNMQNPPNNGDNAAENDQPQEGAE